MQAKAADSTVRALIDEAMAMAVTLVVLELNIPLLIAITWINFRHLARHALFLALRLALPRLGALAPHHQGNCHVSA